MASCGVVQESPSQKPDESAGNSQVETAVFNLRGGGDESGFPSVVSVSSISNMYCSGFVISPRQIITSATCVGPVNAPKKTVAGVLPGQNRLNYPDRIIIHPGFKTGAVNLDIAILEFNNPLPISRSPLKLMTLETFNALKVNTPLIAVGFGVNNIELRSSGKKRSGKVSVSGLASVTNSKKIDGSEVIVTKPGDRNQTACYGDAGGPAFLASDPSVAIGIFSSFSLANFNCLGQQTSYYVSFSNTLVRSWLESELARLNYRIEKNGSVVPR